MRIINESTFLFILQYKIFYNIATVATIQITHWATCNYMQSTVVCYKLCKLVSVMKSSQASTSNIQLDNINKYFF